ncbi:hypothetical protein KCH_23840 [Kitasatospora cheerisanensis KCTC 2395]|uniref:Uncharacterized protein n=1 Tax=Kitasatospora cheerisanensis KCTC 2395 TaxID=1348663 RepID=A0A066Z5Y6_9ACTN|nr:hypothetical protein KCH_23840 [Kitasatospora cheerisanensis KCTC 2395]
MPCDVRRGWALEWDADGLEGEALRGRGQELAGGPLAAQRRDDLIGAGPLGWGHDRPSV